MLGERTPRSRRAPRERTHAQGRSSSPVLDRDSAIGGRSALSSHGGNMKRAGLVLFVLCVLGSASNGWAMSKGSSVLAIQIGQGTADVVDTDLQGGLWAPAPQPEINAQLEYWHAFAEDYAFNISAGAGYF